MIYVVLDTINSMMMMIMTICRHLKTLHFRSAVVRDEIKYLLT